MFVFAPWSTEAGAQKDLPRLMQDYTRAAGLERVALAFEATFAALAPQGAMTAYRTPSVSGHAIYGGAPTARPAGRIALLRIDGNHDVACAAEDVALCAPLVPPGGWMAIDGYCWRYGDGPKLGGDALLERRGDGVARAFVAGDCPFVQRALRHAASHVRALTGDRRFVETLNPLWGLAHPTRFPLGPSWWS